MDVPEDIEDFKKKLGDYFERYPRCQSEVVHVRQSSFARLVTDKHLLNKQVEVLSEAMSQT